LFQSINALVRLFQRFLSMLALKTNEFSLIFQMPDQSHGAFLLNECTC
jgi:hypothetical protein